MSHPESGDEKRWMEKVHQLGTVNGTGKVEFAVISMTASDLLTHVGLEPIVPEELAGDNDDRCHICGGPNH